MHRRYRSMRERTWDQQLWHPGRARARAASRLRFSCTSDAGRGDTDRMLRDFEVVEPAVHRAGDRAEALR